jgi:primosomal protein N'
MQEALQHGRGQIDLEELKRQLDIQKTIGELIASKTMVATRESLRREQNMIAAINRGNGRHPMLGGEDRPLSPGQFLSPEQQHAVTFILKSRDFAVCLQGAAGTGKTATLKELENGLTQAGRKIAAIAPTQTAVRELKQRGFSNAITIARLLQDPKAQESLFGKVLIVDEAGMVSGEQMAGILDLAEKNLGRLIFVGDTKQIKSIQASDALRILQKESKLKTVKLRVVKRQIDPCYRAAAKMLWKNRAKGFSMLEKMGAVTKVDYLDRPKATVDAFFEAKAKPNVKGEEPTVIVVAPTHREIDRYTEAIRDRLREYGSLWECQKLDCLEPLNWTTAQRKDIRRYQPGQVLVFHKEVKYARKNEAVTILRTEGTRIICASEKHGEVTFTGKQAGAFGVFQRHELEVAPGDQILLQANYKDRWDQITNGDVAIVRSTDSQGRISSVQRKSGYLLLTT